LGGSGIVYVRNRRETQEIARILINNGIAADYYHAGLPGHERDQKQDQWMNNGTRVIVATNAFGMGIDKSDVRFVIHLDLPDSLEAYYQEAGRAGRDGKKAYPVILYQKRDEQKLVDNLHASFPEIPFIQQTYHYLCNHFQIPYGAGEGLTVDFDVVTFAKKYQLPLVPVMSALKFLERDSWLTLSEAVTIPSRFKFEIDAAELYKVQVQYVKYDKLIKAILRTYGGVFENYVLINEYEFAKKLGFSYDRVVEILKSLEALEIASYLPSTDAPQLTFLQNRVDYKNLYIDYIFIRDRHQVKEEQVNGMIAYIEQAKCRSQSLLLYFGEQNAGFCQVCDLCLIRNHNDKKRADIKAEIKNSLLGGPKGLHELVADLTIGTEKRRIEIIRELLDAGKIRLDENLYSWDTLF